LILVVILYKALAEMQVPFVMEKIKKEDDKFESRLDNRKIRRT